MKGYSQSSLGSVLMTPHLRALYERVWDEADYVVPPSDNGAFFVTTNVVITPNQTLGHCPEVTSCISQLFGDFFYKIFPFCFNLSTSSTCLCSNSIFCFVISMRIFILLFPSLAPFPFYLSGFHSMACFSLTIITDLSVYSPQMSLSHSCFLPLLYYMCSSLSW